MVLRLPLLTYSLHRIHFIISNKFPQWPLKSVLGPVFCEKEKSLSWVEESPSHPSQLQRAFIMTKKVGPLARANSTPAACSIGLKQHSRMLWLSRDDRVNQAGRAEVFIWRKVGSARRVSLPSQPSQVFVSHVNSLPRFVRREWLAKCNIRAIYTRKNKTRLT